MNQNAHLGLLGVTRYPVGGELKEGDDFGHIGTKDSGEAGE